MSVAERLDYSMALLVAGGLLGLVPLVDIWQDVTAGKPLFSTLLENSIFLFLVALFIGLTLWLRRNDWDDEYVQLVGRWSLTGVVAVSVVYGWVLGFQLFVQNDLKPFVIAADGVVIGGIVLFVAGVFNAQSARESEARLAEQDRFSSLYDNTADAVAGVRRRGDTTVFADVNEPFQTVFGVTGDAVVGRPVEAVFADDDWQAEATATARETPAASALQSLVSDPTTSVELRAETTEGMRDFVVIYIPIAADSSESDWDGFLVFTDITPQKRRERQLATLSEGTEGLFEAPETAAVLDVLLDVATTLFSDAVVGVWSYDAESNQYQPHAKATDGGTLPAIDAADDATEGPPTLSPETVADCLDDDGFAIHSAVVNDLGDGHRFVVCPEVSSLSGSEQSLVDLLVANTRTALEQLSRRETVVRRNDQLEFVNSLLRHEIQNSMTIIRARGQALAESTSDRNAEYAETIVDQSADVISLIDRFRALLDALTGEGTKSAEPVSLVSALDAQVETLRSTYQHVTVAVDAPETAPVLADDMVASVLGNVLGNAVEHNDTDQPTVAVSVSADDRTTTVRVADDGPGIPDDEREAVFRRGNRGLKDENIGSGFGLFFVDRMMDRYGGDVHVEANDPRGSVFVLTFRSGQRDEPIDT